MGNVIDNMIGEAKVSAHSLSANSELGAPACFKNDVTRALTLWLQGDQPRHPSGPPPQRYRGGLRQYCRCPRPATSSARELRAGRNVDGHQFLNDMLTVVGASKEERKPYMTYIDGVEGGLA
jgi:hypothetical protein